MFGLFETTEENIGQGDLIDQIHRTNEVELNLVPSNERHALCRSPAFMERFMQILQPNANIPPAMRAVFAYDFQASSELGRITTYADPSLDLFANLQIRKFDNIEKLGVFVTHALDELVQSASIGTSAVDGGLLSHLIPRSVVAKHEGRQGRREVGERKAILEEMQFMQFTNLIVETLISVKMLPDVYMQVAYVTMGKWVECLTEIGVSVSNPQMAIVLEFCRKLTIEYAINIVFLTELLPSEKFTIESVMRVYPFLFCTEQICMYAFTQLAELFVKPYTDVVVKVLARLCAYDDGTKTSDTSFDKNCATDGPDYDYLRLAVQKKSKHSDPLGCLVDAVSKFLVDDMIFLISEEMILDILVSLKDKRFRCKMYDPTSGDIAIDHQTWNAPVLEIANFPHRVRILRAYVDDVYQRKDEDPIHHTIMTCFHEFTPNQRYLLGSTMRRRDNEFFPQLFETMDGCPNEHNQLIMTNPAPDGPNKLVVLGNFDDIMYEDFIKPFPPVSGAYRPSSLALFPFEVQGSEDIESYPAKRITMAMTVRADEIAPPPPADRDSASEKYEEVKRQRLEEE
jgi:hypothetical protein